MKIKKLLTLLLVFVMCFTFVACNNTDDSNKPAPAPTATAAPESASEPLLYKVNDSEGNIAWMFGSIHAGRADFYPLPDYVMNAYNNADSLAVEVDLVAFSQDVTLQTDALSVLVYSDGTTIKDHLPEEVYTQAVAIMEEIGLYDPMMDYYCPMFWSSAIESSSMGTDIADPNLGIDMFFLNSAKESGKKILEVESPKAQYELMASFSDELQTIMLAEAVAAYGNKSYEEQIINMMDLWASGDEAAFAAFLETDTSVMTEEQKAIYAEYMKEMFSDRNILMADFTENALKSGEEVFVCVGAAHVIGVDSMIELLTDRGYTVERITE